MTPNGEWMEENQGIHKDTRPNQRQILCQLGGNVGVAVCRKADKDKTVREHPNVPVITSYKEHDNNINNSNSSDTQPYTTTESHAMESQNTGITTTTLTCARAITRDIRKG
jgi:hypothetical protein